MVNTAGGSLSLNRPFKKGTVVTEFTTIQISG